MQLTPHQPITIPSINLQPRTSTFDWYVYRGQVTCPLGAFIMPALSVTERFEIRVQGQFFGRLKTELFYPRNWRATTIEQFIEAVDSYIRWYNEKRIKISLGSLSPIEYRVSPGLVA